MLYTRRRVKKININIISLLLFTLLTVSFQGELRRRNPCNKHISGREGNQYFKRIHLQPCESSAIPSSHQMKRRGITLHPSVSALSTTPSRNVRNINLFAIPDRGPQLGREGHRKLGFYLFSCSTLFCKEAQAQKRDPPWMRNWWIAKFEALVLWPQFFGATPIMGLRLCTWFAFPSFFILRVLEEFRWFILWISFLPRYWLFQLQNIYTHAHNLRIIEAYGKIIWHLRDCFS